MILVHFETKVYRYDDIKMLRIIFAEYDAYVQVKLNFTYDEMEILNNNMLCLIYARVYSVVHIAKKSLKAYIV